ncbi:amino acid ABC transporter substrate-binding protein [Roseococcus sp. YIM B11640]|uniref:amino acid ABC transporter substrate-binding protein n=1 Tax=Roseococcus sp. YIM B11640 TaxID=3133973 RepID=UPI003C7D9040
MLTSWLRAPLAALAFCAAAWTATEASAQANLTSPTLNQIRQRGTLICGVNAQTPGFTTIDSRGEYRGMVADLCRGLSASIFGDATKVRFVPLSFATRFTALNAGEVDLLFLTSTMTVLRDTTLGLRFVEPYFYDGHGFMARRDANVQNVRGLAGATICLNPGTTNEQITAEYFRSQNLQFRPVLLEQNEQVLAALSAGRCDAFGFDASGLAAMRSALPNPNDWVILPERFSKEPYTAVIRRGDERWFEILRWFTFALIEAEEQGVTAANAEEMRRTSQDANVRRLLGAVPEVGQGMGLDPAWAFNAIRAIGNYGELYNRSLGPTTPLAMPRAQNEIWTRGGLLYAPPFR